MSRIRKNKEFSKVNLERRAFVQNLIGVFKKSTHLFPIKKPPFKGALKRKNYIIARVQNARKHILKIY